MIPYLPCLKPSQNLAQKWACKWARKWAWKWAQKWAQSELKSEPECELKSKPESEPKVSPKVSPKWANKLARMWAQKWAWKWAKSKPKSEPKSAKAVYICSCICDLAISVRVLCLFHNNSVQLQLIHLLLVLLYDLLVQSYCFYWLTVWLWVLDWTELKLTLCTVLCSSLNMCLWQVSLAGSFGSLIGYLWPSIGLLLWCIWQLGWVHILGPFKSKPKSELKSEPQSKPESELKSEPKSKPKVNQNRKFHNRIWLVIFNHPIPKAKFLATTALLNRSTYHKSAKGFPPPYPQIWWAPQINEKADSKSASNKIDETKYDVDEVIKCWKYIKVWKSGLENWNTSIIKWRLKHVNSGT